MDAHVGKHLAQRRGRRAGYPLRFLHREGQGPDDESGRAHDQEHDLPGADRPEDGECDGHPLGRHARDVRANRVRDARPEECAECEHAHRASATLTGEHVTEQRHR